MAVVGVRINLLICSRVIL